MTHKHIRLAAYRLQHAREKAQQAEANLVLMVDSFCDGAHGNMVGMASALEISTAYMSDVRRGKRNISDAMVERMAGLR